MKSKALPYYIKEFFDTYLTKIRNYSDNTIQSYRDTIKLFLLFNKAKNKSIDYDILTIDNVNDFLSYLKEEKNSIISTINQRLACIKSLCSFISEYEITYLYQLQQVIRLKQQRNIYPEIDFLTKE